MLTRTRIDSIWTLVVAAALLLMTFPFMPNTVSHATGASSTAGVSTFFDDFSGDTPGLPPTGYLLRGATTVTPTVQDVGGVGPAYQQLNFPDVPWLYNNSWAIQDSLALAAPYTVTTKLNFQESVADRAGITIAWNDQTWDHIDIQPNVYGQDIEFRVSYSGPITSNVQITGPAATGGGLPINAFTDYWLRAAATSNGPGQGQVMVYWSTDDVTFTPVLTATGLADVSGLAGLGTAGPHLPDTNFDDFQIDYTNLAPPPTPTSTNTPMATNTPSATTTANPTSTPTPLAGGFQVSVPANQPWTDTGIQAPGYPALSFSYWFNAWGTIHIAASDPGKGPDGDQSCIADSSFVAPGLPCWSLIGRFGPDGTPFFIGSISRSGDMGVPPGEQELYLGVNDQIGEFGDNSGAWTVNGIFTVDSYYPTNTPTPSSTPTLTPTPPDTATPTNTPTLTPTPTNTPVVAALSVSPPSGAYGQSITIAGSGFGAGETVNMYADTIDSTPIYSATTDSLGAFTLPATVQQGAYGPHTLIAVGSSSGISATAPFTILSQTTLQKTSGGQGLRDSLSGYGFAANEAVLIYWGQAGGKLLGAKTANSLGSFSGASALAFTVPMSPTGSYPIVSVGQASGSVVTSTFSLVPTLSITPKRGAHGSTATVAGKGYRAAEAVTVKWNCATATCASKTILGTATTNANGDFSGLSVTIPSTATIGTYYVGGRGSSGTFARTTFTVTS